MKVVDFGIAQVEDQNTRLTATGMAVGTPNYVCPEVCLGKEVDNRSDLFSLGIVFYEMLTGQALFKADSPLAMMTNVVNAEVPNITAINPLVDAKLREILNHLLEKSPDQRYQSCGELLADLESYNAGREFEHAGSTDSGSTVLTDMGTLPPAEEPEGKRTGRTTKIVSLVLVVAATITAGWWYLGGANKETSPTLSQEPPVGERIGTPAPPQSTAAEEKPVTDQETGPLIVEEAPALISDEPAPGGATQATATGTSEAQVQPEPANETASLAANQDTPPGVSEDVGPQAALDTEPAASGELNSAVDVQVEIADATTAAPEPTVSDATAESPTASQNAAPPDPGLIVYVTGDATVSRAVESVLKNSLYAADFGVLNENLLEGFSPGMSVASLSSIARARGVNLMVIAEIVQTGTRTLEYYGRSDRQSLANLKVEVISLRQGRNIGAPWQSNLEYVALTADQQGRAAAGPIAKKTGKSIARPTALRPR